MDTVNIKGVVLTPLKIIVHPKGDIYHVMKKSDNSFINYGEVYCSIINQGEIKGWNRHKRMTLNLVVPMGSVTFIIYDDRKRSTTKSNHFKVDLSLDNYQRLTVPPGLWVAFKGNSYNKNLILNIADIEHNSPTQFSWCN